MQRLSIGLLRPDMIAALDVADPAGRMLIRAGNPFQANHIRAITEYGYGSVYVNLPFLAEVSSEMFLATDFHLEAVKLLTHVYEDFRLKSDIDAGPVRDLASRLVNQVILNRTTPFQWADLRSGSDYLPAHVLSVAALSILIGLKLEYTPAKLHELAIGALVMDIGEMAIPAELFRKKDKLLPEEMAEVKKHPELGFDGLRKKMRGLPAPSLHVAYQHHESFNGNGYPRGIAGNDIHEYARVVAVADMFDALVSDRPFRHYYLNHEAASILQAFAGKILDPDMVSLLLSQVALYPTGTVVQVDTGELAEVEMVTADKLNRPKLRLLTDAWGNRIKEKNSIDLTKQKTRHIGKVLKDVEIAEWIST